MKTWLNRSAAFFIAWAVPLGLFELSDSLEETNWTPFAIAWICVGAGIRLVAHPPVAMPDGDMVDVVGAMVFLWRSAVWPWRWPAR